MDRFKAIWITKDDDAKRQNPPEIREIGLDDLMDGDVTVRIEQSTINYKDGLAVTGKSPVVRRFPMIPGIDFTGEVVSSDVAEFETGEKVLLNGFGVGETHLGGFAGYARVKSDWLIPRPDDLTGHEAMAIGTAGYTAMLCVIALERHGVTPERGPVLVTGAAGGVGSVAISILGFLGYEVVASTGRKEQEESYLKDLGATEVIERSELEGTARPIAKERWAGAIDTVGSQTLANVLSMIRYGGAVAACGLAGGMDLPGSVAPFILRGVSLLGIDSVMAPKRLRIEAYERLVRDLDRDRLTRLSSTIGFDEIIPMADEILAGRVRGRLIVEID